jgi:isochorismate synthase
VSAASEPVLGAAAGGALERRAHDPVQFAAAALAELGERAPDAIAVVSVPAPASDPWLLAGADLVWAPPGGAEIAGRGVAAELTAAGERRFAEIAARGEALLGRVAERRQAGSAAPPPRLYGGFAFAPSTDGGARGFGDARFVLPRLLIGRDRGRGFVQIACPTPAERAARERAIAELAGVLRDGGAVAPTPPSGRLVDDEPRGFLDRVARVLAALGRGEAHKIVCARSVAVELDGTLELGGALAALTARFADCYRFAFTAGPTRFVGGSPELLIRRDGDAIASESLAGTAPRGGDGRALLASRKDRGEQEVVTDAIAGALAPLCSALELPGGPEVRELGPVRHLRTPIRGRLREPRHVLELAARLHPTPAVGGWPRAAALDFIARHEPWRGWYAGCVGWFDGEGDGELAVAIRSATIRGDRAELYAGAGIVAGSEPAAELDETTLKLGAMLDALGVPPVPRWEPLRGAVPPAPRWEPLRGGGRP